MVNAFLYSVYGQRAGEEHIEDPAIAVYRHRWLDALFAGPGVQAVISFGHIARRPMSSGGRRRPGRRGRTSPSSR